MASRMAITSSAIINSTNVNPSSQCAQSDAARATNCGGLARHPPGPDHVSTRASSGPGPSGAAVANSPIWRPVPTEAPTIPLLLMMSNRLIHSRT